MGFNSGFKGLRRDKVIQELLKTRERDWKIN